MNNWYTEIVKEDSQLWERLGFELVNIQGNRKMWKHKTHREVSFTFFEGTMFTTFAGHTQIKNFGQVGLLLAAFSYKHNRSSSLDALVREIIDFRLDD